MKNIIFWLLSGVLGLVLTVQYGNQRPMGLVGATSLVIGGPISLAVGLVAVAIKESPCVFNCEVKQ